MLNISDASKEIYLNGNIPKAVTITFPNVNVTITNSDIVNESLELIESIENGHQLSFQGCIATQLKFKCAGIVIDLRGEYVTAKLSATGAEDIPLFKGYVDQQNNQTHEDIITEFVCYDALYQKGDIECADWYQGLTFPMSVKAFRDSFFNFIGITQKDTSLINDSLSMVKTVSVGTSLKSRYIMQSICQANARYGRIGRDGLFEYVQLPDIAITQGTYPSTETFPGENTFPGRPQQTQILTDSMYESVEYDPYDVEPITKVVVWDEAEIVKGEAGNGTNILKIAGNVVAFSVDLNACARNIFSEVDGITCTSTRINLVGLPFIECGDVYKYNTRLNMINSYVFNRTLKGIQAQSDSYTSDLDQYQSDDDSLSNQIIRLDGKTNKLTRTVDETRSELTSFEQDTDGNITEMRSSISQTAEAITSEVTRASEAEGKLSSSIKQTADAITSEVKRASEVEGNLSTSIKQTADAITTKVSKGDVSSEISQEAGEISIKSNRISIISDNFTLTKNGTITANNGTFSGTITSTNGNIAGFTIKNNAIYNGKTSLTSTSQGVYIGTDGINIGSGSNGFKVTSNGEITATLKGTIAGFTIGNTAIYSGKSSLSSTSQGVYLGTDGIAVGTGSSGFKATRDGSVELKGSSSFSLISGSYQMNLTAQQIDFGYGSSKTKITYSKVSVSDKNYLDASGFHSHLSSGNYLDIYGGKIDFGGSSSGAGEISVRSKSAIDFFLYNSNVGITVNAGYLFNVKSNSICIGASNSNVNIGFSGGKLGFFATSPNQTGQTKQTVNKLASSATLSNVVTKVNDLLTALKNYGLINST